MSRKAFLLAVLATAPAVLANPVPSCPTTLVDFHPSPERNRSSVTVRRGAQTEGFWWTERNLAEIFDPLDGFYPEATFFSLAGKKVLDAGCGAGTAVFELRSSRPFLPAVDGLPERPLPGPVDAHGVDLYLSAKQADRPFFRQADLEKLPFEDETFDVVLATWTVFSYRQPDENVRALGELARVTRRGGRIHLGPIAPGHALRYVTQVPGLRLVRLPYFDTNGGRGFPSAELERR